MSYTKMPRFLSQIALIVADYDEAIAYYTGVLGFKLVENNALSPSKRWVVVAPSDDPRACRIVLAKADDENQNIRIGNQTGGRVAFFLHTDDFWRDHKQLVAQGVQFVREPIEQPYGTVGVFVDLYGNMWDLIERKSS